MNITAKGVFFAAAGIVSVVAALSAISNFIVWRSEFDRAIITMRKEATEREIQMREEAICWWRANGKEKSVQLCMQEFARLKAIRLSKKLSQ